MKRQTYKIVYIILTFLVTVAFIRALGSAPIEQFHASWEELVPTDEWEQKVLDIQGGKCGEFSIKVPQDIDKKSVIAIKGYNSFVTAFLEKEEIYSFEDVPWEKGPYWQWIELPADAAGKTVTLDIVTYNGKKAPVLEGNIYFGSQNTVFLVLLKENIYALFLGGLMIIIGIVVCFSSIALRIKVEGSVKIGMNYLGAFILMSGIWIVTDSYVMQFFTGKTSVVYIISFVAFMLMPYFLLMFISKMMFYENKELMVLCHLHLLNMISGFSLFLLHLVSPHRILPGIHILIIASIIVVLKCAIIELRHRKNKEMKKITIGILSLVGFIGTALLFFYFGHNALYAVFSGVGILVFVVFLIRAGLDRLHYYLVIGAKAEEYQEIARLDIMTHMGNRRAFLEQEENGTQEENGACVVFDINDLKKINDNFGHEEGDGLITDAADCIKNAFAPIGKCYRIGGDEFAAILPTTSEKEIEKGIARLRKQVAFKNLGRIHPVKIAYGYAIWHEEASTFQDLFNEADANMYAKKQEMKQSEKKKESTTGH